MTQGLRQQPPGELLLDVLPAFRHWQQTFFLQWLPSTHSQVLHQQPTGELLLDVRTEAGQELEGLPAADCCLQVQRMSSVCCIAGVPAAGHDLPGRPRCADWVHQCKPAGPEHSVRSNCVWQPNWVWSRTDVCSGTGGCLILCPAE